LLALGQLVAIIDPPSTGRFSFSEAIKAGGCAGSPLAISTVDELIGNLESGVLHFPSISPKRALLAGAASVLKQAYFVSFR